MWFAEGNQSARATFTLLGFSQCFDLQVPLFLVFLTVYAVTVVGNLGMVTIIRISPKLHGPMCFFLSHLSLVDFCCSTQTLGEFGCGRQNPLVPGLHHAIVLSLYVCSGRGIHVGSDGL